MMDDSPVSHCYDALMMLLLLIFYQHLSEVSKLMFYAQSAGTVISGRFFLNVCVKRQNC